MSAQQNDTATAEAMQSPANDGGVGSTSQEINKGTSLPHPKKTSEGQLSRLESHPEKTSLGRKPRLESGAPRRSRRSRETSTSMILKAGFFSQPNTLRGEKATHPMHSTTGNPLMSLRFQMTKCLRVSPCHTFWRSM